MDLVLSHDRYRVDLDALYARMWALGVDDRGDGTRLYRPQPGSGEALKWLIAELAGLPVDTGKSIAPLAQLRRLAHQALLEDGRAERVSQTSFRLLSAPDGDQQASAAAPASDPDDAGQPIDGVSMEAADDGSHDLQLGGLSWSDWVPLAAATALATATPGVYVFRSEGQVVYVGMAGKRRGLGVRGRLRVYARGRGAVSGFGEAALDRALADPAWLTERLADLNTNGPTRTKDWAVAALARVPFEVCWSAAETTEQARAWEAAVLEELEDLALWNRARPKRRDVAADG